MADDNAPPAPEPAAPEMTDAQAAHIRDMQARLREETRAYHRDLGRRRAR